MTKKNKKPLMQHAIEYIRLHSFLKTELIELDERYVTLIITDTSDNTSYRCLLDIELSRIVCISDVSKYCGITGTQIKWLQKFIDDLHDYKNKLLEGGDK